MTHAINFFQQTLRNAFTCVGKGLHSGYKVVMRVMPGEVNSGYVFERRDVQSRWSEIPVRWDTVCDTRLSTTIKNKYGVRVCTIEHLLAALYVCGIDNARIILDGPELPVMDGSAAPFLKLIKNAGIKQQNEERHAIVIKQTVSVSDGHKFGGFMPSPVPWASTEIHFDSVAIGYQKFSIPIDGPSFESELAAARTFGFIEQKSTLNQLGLAQGSSLQNTVVVDKNNIMNHEGLRYKDEFVRHKLVDVIGDIATLGALLFGHVTTKFAGHQVNHALIRELMNQPHTLQRTSLREAHLLWKHLIAMKN